MSMMLGAAQRDPRAYPEELRHPADGADTACRICGQRRGRRDADELWTLDGPLDLNGPTRSARNDLGERIEELVDQPWRWRHVACVPTAATLVAGILGADVPERLARQAVAEAGIGIARHANETARSPWAYVTNDEREALRREVDRLQLEGSPRMHVSGRCGWCGRSRAVRWSASGMRWADGETAALCESCSAARSQVRDRQDEDAVRRAALRLFAGLRDSIGRSQSYGLRLAVEVVSDERRHEDGHEPWDYSAALAAVRERAWTVEAGGIANDELRSTRLELNAARRAQDAAEHAAESEEPALDW